MPNNLRLTVDEAAKMLNITPQMLRIAMQREKLQLGFVFGEGKRKTYVIYRDKVEKILSGGN